MSRQAVVNAAKEVLSGPLPVRLVCPVCLGGSDHEECLVVWDGDDGNVYATCHRARCEINTVMVSGSFDACCRKSGPSVPDTLEPPKKYVPGYKLTGTDKEYITRKCGPDSALAKEVATLTSSSFLKSYPLWTRDGAESGGLMLPMYDINGDERGCVVKPYSSNLPRALTYRQDGYDGMSWYLDSRHMLDARIIVVEDGLSAMALLVKGRSAVSLNGTVLNKERVDLIFRHKKVAYLALDADATSKALSYALTYGSRYKIKVLRLMKDFKNMTDEELEDFLKENEL